MLGTPGTAFAGAVHPSTLRARADAASPQFRRDLAQLVSIDSGSGFARGVDRVGAWCENRMRALGMIVERMPSVGPTGTAYGHTVIGRLRGKGTARVLLFAHLDTVFDVGTAAARPYREDAGRAYGPGVCDDKAGVLAAIHACGLLVEAGFQEFAEIIVALTPDEEIGSPGSATILREIARGADAALCLECARENGDLVIARKGVADIAFEITGRAAHAGVEPERGRNAAVEAAHLLLEAHALADASRGLTVSIGVVRSGERNNVVPARAELTGEVRAATRADLDATLAALSARAGRPSVPGVTVSFAPDAICPPLEPSATVDLFARAREVAAEIGIPLSGAVTGGASDANYVAAAGVPVLDGLGPIGGDDHAESEWLDLASIPERLALLTGLIVRIAAG